MTFLSLIFVALITALLYLIYLLFKFENATKNQFKIVDALETYANETGDFDTALKMVASMEELDKTLFRLWDWGYRNILPYQYFTLIKPYIQEEWNDNTR